MFNEIKSHPYIIGAVILGIIVLFFISSSGSAPGTTVADSSSDVAAANTVADAQQNAQTQLALGNLSLQGLQEQIGGSIAVATLQAHTADNANVLAAGVAAQQINATEDVTNTANTLSAQTQQRYFASQETMASINANSLIQNTALVTDALVKQSQITSNTQVAAVQANKDIATQSWFSKIFG